MSTEIPRRIRFTSFFFFHSQNNSAFPVQGFAELEKPVNGSTAEIFVGTQVKNYFAREKKSIFVRRFSKSFHFANKKNYSVYENRPIICHGNTIIFSSVLQPFSIFREPNESINGCKSVGYFRGCIETRSMINLVRNHRQEMRLTKMLSGTMDNDKSRELKTRWILWNWRFYVLHNQRWYRAVFSTLVLSDFRDSTFYVHSHIYTQVHNLCLYIEE